MTDYKNEIEAILFSSGHLMDVVTIQNLIGASNKQVVVNNVRKLMQEYEDRGSPLMIVEEKDGWKLTVKEPYLPIVRKIISDMELPKSTLETLAVIAWKAPVLQSEVVNVRHNKAYEHIKELEDLQFIVKEKQGRSYVIKLTQKFFDYFDVDGVGDMKTFLQKAKQPDLKIPEIDDVEPPEPNEQEMAEPYVPGVAPPGVTPPSVSEPGVSSPSVNAPGVEEPSVGEPGVSEPGVSPPSVSEPGVVPPSAPDFSTDEDFEEDISEHDDEPENSSESSDSEQDMPEKEDN